MEQMTIFDVLEGQQITVSDLEEPQVTNDLFKEGSRVKVKHPESVGHSLLDTEDYEYLKIHAGKKGTVRVIGIDNVEVTLDHDWLTRPFYTHELEPIEGGD